MTEIICEMCKDIHDIDDNNFKGLIFKNEDEIVMCICEECVEKFYEQNSNLR